MIRGVERLCDGCGQKLPATSKLSQQTVSKQEAAEFGVADANGNSEGTVTIDLCLQCRVSRANRIKHGY
jgi:hypothetical protein